jgi:NAD(P)-dependent dehydrogenase (short-subunit alcohol dehydrogenase family)
MTFADKTILVTGANRGLGQALATEALARNARHVYAGTRRPLAHADSRVTPLMLDITSADQVQAAAEKVGALDVLINNAGLFVRDDLTDPAAIERHLAVNLFGTYAMTQAFLPALSQSRGAVVNILSLSSLAPVPLMPAYSISKAAAFSLTQSLRVLLAGHGVRVHAVLPGPVDTDMLQGVDIPKASPESVARVVFDAVDNGEEDIFPDPVSALIADAWHDGAIKALVRQLAQTLEVARKNLHLRAGRRAEGT